MALKLLRRALCVLKSKNGYAFIAVLCTLMVFSALGTNSLSAAYATVGATAKKQDDAQAYALASSAAVFISGAIEKGSEEGKYDFSKFIRENVMTSAGSTVTTTAEFTLPGTKDKVQIVIDFFAESATRIPGTDYLTGPLEAKITGVYRSSQFTLKANYQQMINTEKPKESPWKLMGYQNDRVQAIIPQTP